MRLGLRDYVEKNRFKSVVLGLRAASILLLRGDGGRRAWSCARSRCDAAYRSRPKKSLADAAAIAQALGIEYDVVPIEKRLRA